MEWFGDEQICKTFWGKGPEEEENGTGRISTHKLHTPSRKGEGSLKKR